MIPDGISPLLVLGLMLFLQFHYPAALVGMGFLKEGFQVLVLNIGMPWLTEGGESSQNSTGSTTGANMMLWSLPGLHLDSLPGKA